MADLRALDEVNSVASYRDGAGPRLEDGHTVLVPVTLTGDRRTRPTPPRRSSTLVEAADGQDGFRVTTVGFGSVEGEMSALLEETLQQGELIGIGVALVILLIVFGAAVAAGLPIVLALLSIFVAAGATALVSNVMEMSNFVVFIITMIGLAVGIDYSLFIVSALPRGAWPRSRQDRRDRDGRRDGQPHGVLLRHGGCDRAGRHADHARRDLPELRRGRDPRRGRDGARLADARSPPCSASWATASTG